MKLKLLIHFFILHFFVVSSMAQVPNGFNYQGIARDVAGNELANTNINIKLSIIAENMEGVIEWQETHIITTNDFGVYSLTVGNGINTGEGSIPMFVNVPWSESDHFMKVEINFGTGYLDMGTTQLLSVPYALVSENVINNDDDDADPSNELQIISISNDTIYLSNGGFVKIPTNFSGSYDDLTDIPANIDINYTDDFSGNYLDLSNKPENISDFNNDIGFITSADDSDSDPTNEIQFFSVSTLDDTLYLSSGSWVIIPGISAAQPQPLSDYDDNVYQTVVIGNQEWMAENMKATHFSDGTPIPKVFRDGWYDLIETDKAYCWYDDDSTSNAATYGVLYTWAAAINGVASSNNNPSGVQGVCPDGWHIPSDNEWKELELYLGMTQTATDSTGFHRGTNEGSKLAGDNDLWTNGNLENDAEFGSSGFLALPGGRRDVLDDIGLGESTDFWSATESTSSEALRRLLSYNSSGISRINSTKSNCLSVRCLKD